MITLYGINSPYVMRVKAALVFKWLDHGQVDTNLRQKSPELLSMNPNGKIPILKDVDGTVVYESCNIVSYLDQKYPETYQMISSDLTTRVKQMHVVGIVDNIGAISMPLAMKIFTGSKWTPEEYDLAFAKIKPLMDSIVKAYDGKQFLTWEFSYADAALMWLVYSSKKFLPELLIPELALWFENIIQIPQIAKILPLPENTNVVWKI